MTILHGYSKQNKKVPSHLFSQISTKWFPLLSLATTNFKFRVWFVKKKKSLFPYWIGFLLSISSDCLQRTVMIKTYQINWPLQMSPVAGTNFALGSNVKFKPSFQNPGWKNRARDLGNRVSPPSHMNTLKSEVNNRDLGNRAHLRRP